MRVFVQPRCSSSTFSRNMLKDGRLFRAAMSLSLLTLVTTGGPGESICSAWSDCAESNACFLAVLMIEPSGARNANGELIRQPLAAAPSPTK